MTPVKAAGSDDKPGIHKDVEKQWYSCSGALKAIYTFIMQTYHYITKTDITKSSKEIS